MLKCLLHNSNGFCVKPITDTLHSANCITVDSGRCCNVSFDVQGALGCLYFKVVPLTGECTDTICATDDNNC